MQRTKAVRRTLVLFLRARRAAAVGSMLDPTAQLQELIQTNPEILDQLRDFFIQRLHEEGSAIDEQSVTDQMIYARWRSDTAIQECSSEWLVDQGTINPETAKGLMASSAQRAPLQICNAGRANLGRRGSASDRGDGDAERLCRTGRSNPRSPTREKPFDDSALNPKTVPQKNPYPDLPSTRALYTQFPERTIKLKAIWLRNIQA